MNGCGKGCGEVSLDAKAQFNALMLIALLMVA